MARARDRYIQSARNLARCEQLIDTLPKTNTNDELNTQRNELASRLKHAADQVGVSMNQIDRIQPMPSRQPDRQEFKIVLQPLSLAKIVQLTHELSVRNPDLIVSHIQLNTQTSALAPSLTIAGNGQWTTNITLTRIQKP